MKKFIFYGIGILLVVTATYFIFADKNGDGPRYKLVEVKKGNIAEKALAVGTIEPEKEIRVKSAISGIISEVHFKVGDRLEKGQPLFKITPNPTPVEYVDARRNMEIAEVNRKQLDKERKRRLALFKDKLIPRAEMEEIQSKYNASNLRYKITREKFQLMEKGHIKVSNKKIDTIVKSPIAGVVLSQVVHEGDPVVPLTNYQPGTELCAMADLSKMLFKGTVDEIDVGKLEPEMIAQIQVGALPDVKISGKLLRISPKAKKDGNATLFDIEVAIIDNAGKTLRAGYSATSYVKVQEHKDVLLLPERLVIFEKDKRFVEIEKGKELEKIEVKTGLSDSLNIEITEGLKEGQKVVEHPPKEIT